MIHIVPFKHVNALSDIKDQSVYLSYGSFLNKSASEIMGHEMSHIISKDVDHGIQWQKIAGEYGLKSDVKEDKLKQYRKRLGIPNYIVGNIGNITGIQNILTDFHLLQAYRKFSQKVLGTEGQWEVLGDNKIRLYPTPRGTFGVVVKYMPIVTQYRTPEARLMAHDAMLAQAKIAIGNSRSKFSGIPSPDGGSLTLNGADLVQQGEAEWAALAERANLLGEPLPIILW